MERFPFKFPSAADSAASLDAVAVADRPSARDLLALGDRLFQRNQFHAAVAQFQQAVRLSPDSVSHHKLALAAWRAGDSTLAQTHLKEVVRLSPRNPKAHEALGQICMEEGQTDMALAHSAMAAELAPNDREVVISRGFVLAHAGREQAAWELIRPFLCGRDTPARAALLYGRIARTVGEQGPALELILGLLRDGTGGATTPSLHFQAAALLDQAGQYDEAFAHARRAHDANRKPYDSSLNARQTDALIRLFTLGFVQSMPRATHASRRPVFIVGMPRSGTSLVEQVLASHPAVYGAGELPILQQIIASLNDSPWAPREGITGSLELLSIRQANNLAEQYLSHIAARNSSATFVTDKLPLNARDLWLVQILFPQAHVIHCVRDARDTCLSCYMTEFAVGSEFAQNLTDLGQFYRDYRRLADHWGKVLDLPILQVRYEAVVEDLEGQARRMLAFLGLDWDERCLRYYENGRYISTASQHQVRRPVYRSSVGRWKHFQKHLGPLLRELPADPAEAIVA